MNAKYTPGPWEMNAFLQPSENHRGWGIYWKGDQSRAFGRRIADVFPDCDSRGDPSEEAQANARLIAAAPVLLAALKAIMQMQYTSPLEACAYQGPPPKKWMREVAPALAARQHAVEEAQVIARHAIAEAEGTP